MKRYLPVFILLFAFFFLKVTNLGIRASDTNIYYLTGLQLLEGKILYKDIFFTNFPLFPYLSAFYVFLFNGSIKYYYLTSTIEVIIAAFFIYLITYKKSEEVFIGTISSALYLFSFIILSTTDHQTGVFAGSLFAVLSYYFFDKRNYLLTGVFIALALLTKAYFLPILVAYVVTIVLAKGETKKDLKAPSHIIFREKMQRFHMFTFGFLTTTFLILLPSLLFAREDFIRDVFQYSLTRSQGIPKGEIALFFIRHDFLFFILLLFNLLLIKRYLFFGLVSVFGIIFFVLYKDIYYLYLNFLVPFLCLSAPNLYMYVKERFQLHRLVIPTILFIFLFFNFVTYFSSFRNLQKIENIHLIAEAIRAEKPSYLYGVNDLTPVLSIMTGVPLLHNIIDTNTNIFRKGYLDAEKLTSDAIKNKTLLISHGAYYPQHNIQQPIVDEIFDMQQIEKSCKIVQAFPAKLEGTSNIFTLTRCY